MPLKVLQEDCETVETFVGGIMAPNIQEPDPPIEGIYRQKTPGWIRWPIRFLTTPLIPIATLALAIVLSLLTLSLLFDKQIDEFVLRAELNHEKRLLGKNCGAGTVNGGTPNNNGASPSPGMHVLCVAGAIMFVLHSFKSSQSLV